LTCLQKRGVLVCIGHGEGLTLLRCHDLIATGQAVARRQSIFVLLRLPEILNQLRTRIAHIRQIITHRYPVKCLQEAFESFFRGETGRW